MSEETSPAGTPILRHTTAADDGPRPTDAALEAAVGAHLERHAGPVALVWRDEETGIAVHAAAPDEDRPAWVLLTSGMSASPMGEAGLRAELTLLLPGGWPAPGDPATTPAEVAWPFDLLCDLAAIPRRYATTLWTGHTVPNGDPAQPYADGTGLAGCMLIPPLLAPDGFERLEHAGAAVDVLAVLPLHADELAFKLEHGTDAFADRADDAALTELVDPGRASIVARRRRWRRR